MTLLAVRLRPGARRDEVLGFRADGALQVAVSAPPEDGRANRALVELLAEALGVKASAVRIKRGATSRSKTVEVEGLGKAEAEKRLSAAIEERKGKHGE